MWKDDAYLLDILLAARDVRRFLQGADWGRFQSDDLLHCAVMQRLTVIGEASSKLSPQFRCDHPEVPWKSIIGMRNILVHAYGDVKLDRVWHAANGGVADLIAFVEPLVPPEPTPDAEPGAAD